MNESLKLNLLRLAIFAIAMAFLESAVVIYMRELYYPEGFSFPLKPIKSRIILTELIREAATLVMLICIARMVSKKGILRFANFLFAFAIWDLFYYVFLKLVLDWPESALTWDVLFLIPVVWVGPVIAPVLLSCLMIAWTLVLYHISANKVFPLLIYEWMMLIAGAMISIVAFIQDYIIYSRNKANAELLYDTSSYVPERFDWALFLFSVLLIIIPMFTYVFRYRKNVQRRQMMQLF